MHVLSADEDHWVKLVGLEMWMRVKWSVCWEVRCPCWIQYCPFNFTTTYLLLLADRGPMLHTAETSPSHYLNFISFESKIFPATNWPPDSDIWFWNSITCTSNLLEEGQCFAWQKRVPSFDYLVICKTGNKIVLFSTIYYSYTCITMVFLHSDE
jgi:hypothetical protein